MRIHGRVRVEGFDLVFCIEDLIETLIAAYPAEFVPDLIEQTAMAIAILEEIPQDELHTNPQALDIGIRELVAQYEDGLRLFGVQYPVLEVDAAKKKLRAQNS